MSFLGTIVGGLTGGLKGLVTGGPIGALAGLGSGLLGHPSAPPTPPITTFAPISGGTTPFGPNVPASYPGSVPVPGFYHGTLSRLLPGGETGYTGAPPGYHVNKRYMAYVRAGQLGKALQDPTQTVQVRNVVVKNRSINPLNPRALKRANARQHAAVRLMRRAMRGTGWHITRQGFGGRKRRR